MAVGVPSGYNSKGDFFLGITSQMRDNEKSKSPGYPGNQTSVAKKLSQLKDQEKTVLQFKPLPSMQVSEEQISSYVETLETEKSKVGVNDQYYDANDVPKMSLVPEKEKSESFETLHAPNFGVDNSMLSSPGTPGSLASAIDQKNADNEQLVADAKIHEAAKVGEQLKEAWKEGVISSFGNKDDVVKNAAIDEFANSRNANDDNFNIVDLNLNDEILNTSNKDLKISSGVAFEAAQKEAKKNAEKLMDEMKEDNRRNMSIEEEEQLYLNQNNGLDYHETLGKKIEEETGLPPQGAIFTSTDDIPDTFTLPDGEVVSSVGVDYIEQLRQRKETERKEKEALMEAVSEKLKYTDDGRLISEMTDEEKSIHALEQGYNDAGQDQDFIDAKNKALKEREKALRTTNEIADEKLIEKARLEKLRQEEVARVEAKHNRNERQDAFSGQGTDAVDPIKNQRGILDRIDEERKGGESEATQLRQNQDFANSLDAEQKLMQEKTLHERQINSETADNVSANFDKDRNHYRKMQAIKKTAADVNASENAFQEDNGAVNVRSMMRGGGKDPYHFTTLAYPPEAVNSQENGHFMLFYVNVQNKTKYSYNGYKNGQIVPVGDMVSVSEFTVADETNVAPSERAGKLITEYKPGAQAAGIAGPVEYQKQMIRNGGRGNIIYNNQKVLMKGRKSPGQNLASKYPTTTRITDSVALYLPSGIGNTTSVNYGDFETGFAGYLAMSGLDVAKGLQEEDFVGVATDLFGKGGTFITDAIKKLALSGMETLGGGEGLQQNFDKIFGQTLNPYIEVAFQSSGMRTFDYTFNFAPKSRAETDEVKAIINLFRFHMLPEMKGTSHRYLTLPSTFDIHYMWQNGRTTAKENSFYNKIATCVLTNVNVNYTPNGDVQSFADGAPTQIAMSLSFKETEMMTKQHVNEGF